MEATTRLRSSESLAKAICLAASLFLVTVTATASSTRPESSEIMRSMAVSSWSLGASALTAFVEKDGLLPQKGDGAKPSCRTTCIWDEEGCAVAIALGLTPAEAQRGPCIAENLLPVSCMLAIEAGRKAIGVGNVVEGRRHA